MNKPALAGNEPHPGICDISDLVRVHVVDDENGFIETADEVRRTQGRGLTGLPARGEQAVLRLLDSLGISVGEPVRPAWATGTIAVVGPESLTAPLITVAARNPGLSVRHADAAEIDENADIVAVATASLFDPAAAAVNAWCVERERACLFYGLAYGGVSFAGPLWSPGRFGACYECLRIRIAANSVHGPTWRAYMRHLDVTGIRPLQQEAAPWTAAMLVAEVSRRLDRWLRDPAQDPSDRLVWWETGLEGAEKHVLAVPNCPVCRGQRATPVPVAGMADAQDNRVGIVHHASVRTAGSGPAVYLSGSTSANLEIIRSPMRVTINSGAAFSKKAALNAAIGESLERYAAGLYRADRLRLASWAELNEAATRPSEYGLFSPQQYAQPGFPYVPFDDDTPVRWVPAERLDTGETVLVPASQVFMYYRRTRGEAAIGPSISTGMAAGQSAALATLSGLYEVIERDALAVSWLHRLPPRPVSADVVARSTQVYRCLETPRSWRVRFFDVSLELAPPVIVAVMEHRDGAEPVMTFGSACRWSASAAIEKAFLEAAQSLGYVRRMLVELKDWEVAEDFSDVDDFHKHAILYTKYPDLRMRASYLVDPETPPACSRPERLALDATEPGQVLETLAGELAARGLPCYRVDLTTPDVRQVDTHVVRVIVPGLQHLAGNHAYQCFGNPRLRNVVAGLGVTSDPDNPYPHPLP